MGAESIKDKQKQETVRKAMAEPGMVSVRARACQLSFFTFVQEFWNEIIADTPQWNWHIPYLCGELMKLAEGVANGEQKPYDLITNIPPGETKSLLFTVFFPAWCWTNWPWMRFIKGSYSASLSLEHAETCRDLIRSDKYQEFFPYLAIKKDKDTKSNFRVMHWNEEMARWKFGGNIYSTSVGGTLTGFHAHILLVDDPLDPYKSLSEQELKNANRWMSEVLPTRKVNKEVAPLIMIMQRLAEDDPTGHLLAKEGLSIKHINLPGEINSGQREDVKPQELLQFYSKDGLLDPKRLSLIALKELEASLGQYGYAGQVQQRPTPPSGGMFKPDNMPVLSAVPNDVNCLEKLWYWDKAGTKDGGTYTVGTYMWRMDPARSPYEFVIVKIVRGQWGTDEREKIIQQEAEAEDRDAVIFIEQEGGSGGKESAEKTIMRLSGFKAYADHPTGDKVARADPFSVQVNVGNVAIVQADWNKTFKDELRYFPYSTYKDQVDSSSGAFNNLTPYKRAGVW